MTTTTSTLTRNQFDALVLTPAPKVAADTLLAAAIEAGKLEKTYFHRIDKRNAETLNYDVYNISSAAILVQQRVTKITKYGSSATKEYFIVRRCGKGVRVTEATKHKVRKTAQISTKFGQTIDILEGRTKAPKVAKPAAPKFELYFQNSSALGCYGYRAMTDGATIKVQCCNHNSSSRYVTLGQMSKAKFDAWFDDKGLDNPYNDDPSHLAALGHQLKSGYVAA